MEEWWSGSNLQNWTDDLYLSDFKIARIEHAAHIRVASSLISEKIYAHKWVEGDAISYFIMVFIWLIVIEPDQMPLRASRQH